MADTNGKTYFPITFNADNSFSIVNNGTAAAPCRLTIIPTNDVMLMKITGLSDEELQVSKIKSGQILVIDGIDKTITIDGKESFEQYNGWQFPKLMPGTNIITITDAATATISIEYQPRYI